MDAVGGYHAGLRSYRRGFGFIRKFTYGDACVEKGPKIAFNAAASTKAHADVRAFLTGLFKLGEAQ